MSPRDYDKVSLLDMNHHMYIVTRIILHVSQSNQLGARLTPRTSRTPPAVMVYGGAPARSGDFVMKATRSSFSQLKITLVVHACAYDSPSAGTNRAGPSRCGFTVT